MKNIPHKAATIASNPNILVDSGIRNHSLVFSFIHERPIERVYEWLESSEGECSVDSRKQ